MAGPPHYHWSLTVTLNWQFGAVPDPDTLTLFPAMEVTKQLPGTLLQFEFDWP
jgi:hypothetical protein